MAQTSVTVNISLNPYNTYALQNSTTIMATNINNISNIDNITPAESKFTPYLFITFEHNINILDGSLSEYITELHEYGYISNNLSDDSCNSNNKIIIEVEDGNVLTLYGILLNFGGNTYISNVNIIYNLGGGGVISSAFQPNNYIYRAILDGQKVSKIEIQFTTTRFPRMFTRLFELTDDLSYILSNKDIISCNISDSFSPISQVIPINTGEIVIYSHSGDLDLISNMSILKMLRSNSRCEIISEYNDKNIQIGVYYIDKVEGQGKDSIKFNIKSYSGTLDDYTYQPQYIYTDTGNNLIREIFPKGYHYASTPLVFDKTYSHIRIPSGTLRESLQALMFMLNGAVTDRAGIIQFYKPQYYVTSQIQKDIIINSPILRNDNDINTISIDTYDYIPEYTLYNSDLTYSSIFEGKIPEGGVTLIFDKPVGVFRYKIRSDSGAFISDYGDPVFPGASGTLTALDNWSYKSTGTYALTYNFNPQNSSTIDVRNVSFIIEINYEIENKNTYTFTSQNKNTDVPRLIKIQNPKIFNKYNISDFANGLLEYYSRNPLVIETKYIWDGYSRVGDTVYIYTEYDNYVRATIIKQSLDLGNGCIASITAVGKEINIFEDEYMSDGNDNSGNSGQYDIIMQDNIQF